MQQLLAQVNSQCGWDCIIKSFDGWSLYISGGTSPEYAVPLVEFTGVTYISCPTEFSHPKFRVASQVEREQVKCLTPLDDTDFLVAIEAETMAGVNRHIFYIAATSGALNARA